MKKAPAVTQVRPAGRGHQVVTIEGGNGSYRRQPCAKCPWRLDTVGEFPAEAFRHSANTAYDMSTHMFGCHDSGAKKPATCAGFLLRGSDHNLGARLARMMGRVRDDVSDGGHALFSNYREMAVANGVEPNDVVLGACRD